MFPAFNSGIHRLMGLLVTTGGLLLLTLYSGCYEHPGNGLAGGPEDGSAIQTPDDRSKGQPLPDAVSDDVQHVGHSNNRFGLDLFRQLRQQEEGNAFLSPASLATALTMVYAGAEAETHREMASVLHIEGEEPVWLAACGEFAQLLNAEGEGYLLRMANRLWGQQGYAFRDDYLERIGTHFGAPLAEVDFIQETEQARQIINDWVAEETNRRIEDLIPEGVLDDMTRLVLTNAIYFKADWQSTFSKDATRDEEFHLDAEQTITVPLMRQTERFRYREDEQVQVLQMPYRDPNLSMVVVLPREGTGLEDIEQALTAEMFNEWVGELESRRVRVLFPKFKMTSEYQLKQPLIELGMGRAFSRQAQLGRISSQDPLEITEVVHQAFVEVDEEGTEAAAATGAVVGVTAMPIEEDPVEFRADRPFLFVIHHAPSESILFLGRLTDPR